MKIIKKAPLKVGIHCVINSVILHEAGEAAAAEDKGGLGGLVVVQDSLPESHHHG